MDGATAVVLAVGTELTEGIVQDSHVRFLAQELRALGFELLRAVLLPDDRARFIAELARAGSEASLVVASGGLGPTADDVTREVVAHVAKVPLAFHPEVWEAIVDRFAGRSVPDTNRSQAMTPEGFTVIPNATGTACGFAGPLGKALVIALPGPPRELRPMWIEQVVPVLRARFDLSPPQDTLWGTAFMVGESALEEALRASRWPEAGFRTSMSSPAPSGGQLYRLGPPWPGVAWGTRVEEDRIVFSLRRGTAGDRAAMFSRLAERLGAARVREGDVRPAALLFDALAEAGMTLATAESCTGGLVGKYLTDLPGSSRVYWGGAVAYANDAKTALVGVPSEVLGSHGAVSAETAIAMAQGALARFGVSLAIAVTGIAGPEGAAAGKPVGTVWIALAARGKPAWSCLCRLAGGRDQVRRKSAVVALLAAEAAAQGKGFLDTPVSW